MTKKFITYRITNPNIWYNGKTESERKREILVTHDNHFYTS